MTIPHRPLRPIRSFMRREGKGMIARASTIKALWPRYGLSENREEGLIDPRAIFGRVAPLIVEIGFGGGESLLQMASLAPDKDFIGIEVYRTGLSQLITQADQAGLQNLRVFCGDAREILQTRIMDASLDTVQIFFPDPWPKRKHYKRRLISADFIKLIALKLKPGGRLHLATDWADYAAWMLNVLSEDPHFENTAGAGCYVPRPMDRPFSKYERRGVGLGHQTWDLIFKRLYNESLNGS
ncbi:MAG: tRNA (guanosine(46)-N7)-methyltransferase TrmB [Gammaproteobacteria bacterium]|nr:tRNA (guanosine(46)-N7)-methyltransferase TrmB [Gammaproteobacteria bacterium]MBP9729105.1 tRNA (guanosine(46)-N7)-methyltransferase TrmB [Gammaproteobacteria bacterium]